MISKPDKSPQPAARVFPQFFQAQVAGVAEL